MPEVDETVHVQAHSSNEFDRQLEEYTEDGFQPHGAVHYGGPNDEFRYNLLMVNYKRD